MRITCNPDLAIRKIDGEIFIYDCSRSLIHTFNETGALLWNALEEGLDREQMSERILAAYDVDKESAAQDIQEFFNTLENLGLVIVAHG